MSSTGNSERRKITVLNIFDQIKSIQKIGRSALPHAEKNLLVSIAIHAGEKKYIWPSNQTLAHYIGENKDYVKNILARLKKKKLITVSGTCKDRRIYINQDVIFELGENGNSRLPKINGNSKLPKPENGNSQLPVGNSQLPPSLVKEKEKKKRKEKAPAPPLVGSAGAPGDKGDAWRKKRLLGKIEKLARLDGAGIKKTKDLIDSVDGLVDYQHMILILKEIQPTGQEDFFLAFQEKIQGRLPN